MAAEILTFPTKAGEQPDNITIEHGPKTIEAVQVMRGYINDLDILSLTKDTLIKLLQDIVLIAEHESYMQGFTDCMTAIQEGGLNGMADKIIRSSRKEF